MATAVIQNPVSVPTLYRHARLLQYTDGVVAFTNPERLKFSEYYVSSVHLCSGEQYLWDIAIQHFGQAFLSGIALHEVIAQFQPEPIQDYSLKIKEGAEIYIPTRDYIEEVARGESLAEYPEL